MKILQIKASLFNESGQSSRLADQFFAQLRADNPGTEVVVSATSRRAGAAPRRGALRRFRREAGGARTAEQRRP